MSMRTLYLVRHGKSSWKYLELDDRQRPLKSRGENDAKLMGRLLKGKNISPGLIVSSPANRAYHTAIIFGEELGYPKSDIIQNEALYFKGVDSIMEVIEQTPDDVNDLFLFGHNPDTLDMVNQLSESPFENVPTSGVACIQFDTTHWRDASLSNGTLRWLDFPSQHK